MKLLAFAANADGWADVPTDTCNHQLYYTTPASIWEETLPLGNGRLGMMPDGGIGREHVVLNEISMWSGSEADYRNPDASKNLPEIRQLLFEGKNEEAQQLMYSSFVPKKEQADGRYGTYQILGDLNIDFTGISEHTPTDNYRRGLNLRNAVAYTTFTQNGVNYRREYFVSRDKDVMLIHLTADRKGALNFSARLSRAERATVSVEGNALLMCGTLDSGQSGQDGMKYRVAMRLLSRGGKSSVSTEKGITLTKGREAWLVLSATTSFEAEGTDFPGERYVAVCDSLLSQLTSLDACAQDKETHIAAHRALYDRVSLTLPATADDALPTNERILRFVGKDSPSLATLYYNYGRYMLMCSTRPGSLPPNLQGLWANTIQTPWNGDYHTNINIQMNHWPLEQAGLSELYGPLTTLIERLLPSGRETARAFYGDKADGWVLHMMTNIWNYTAPGEHPSWGATNTGGAWLCAHLWEHYQYTQDMAYLKRIYPILKGASEFFYTTMVEEPVHGWLVTAPTSSPENAFFVGDSRTAVSICMGPTMDVQLLTELYTNVIEAARLLNCDADYAAQLQAALKKFPPMQISKNGGYLQEWLEDYKEQDVHHRHVSHLYGLHPSNLISPDTTPELADACRVTLNRRGDEGTGWSRAWKINFWARLCDGDRAWKLFKSLLYPAIDANTGKHVGGTYPNLFCSHPPFQLDGNYGGAAGVGEMLLQSQNGYIQLLPALPTCWNEGSFRGMRVRGGATVDLDWKDGRASRARVTALISGEFAVKMPAGVSQAEVVSDGGGKQVYTDARIPLKLKAGEACEINFK
ncbi:MAG: glycoside hydrolase family 95 protein [Bacteroides sp.]|nr:glycoside hydrolase family 95 protein [Bacteroides sp.]